MSFDRTNFRYSTTRLHHDYPKTQIASSLTAEQIIHKMRHSFRPGRSRRIFRYAKRDRQGRKALRKDRLSVKAARNRRTSPSPGAPVDFKRIHGNSAYPLSSLGDHWVTNGTSLLCAPRHCCSRRRVRIVIRSLDIVQNIMALSKLVHATQCRTRIAARVKAPLPAGAGCPRHFVLHMAFPTRSYPQNPGGAHVGSQVHVLHRPQGRVP